MYFNKNFQKILISEIILFHLKIVLTFYKIFFYDFNLKNKLYLILHLMIFFHGYWSTFYIVKFNT